MPNRFSSIAVLSIFVALPALAAPAIDLSADLESVRSEQKLRTGSRAIWTMPFETTQYVPASPDGNMRAALAAQAEGRFIEAIALLEQTAKAAEQDDTQLLRASFYLQAEQIGKAQTILNQCLSKNPGLADAHALLAMTLLWQGRVELAAQAMEKACALDCRPFTYRINTYVLQALGRLQEASAVMAKLNESGPADALNLAREAELALSLNDITRAAQRVESARKIAPDSAYVMAVSGLAWLIAGEHQKAQQAFEIALKRDPQDPKALLGLGLAEARQGGLKQSVAHLQAAAASDPASATIQTYLGRALKQLDQDKQAETAYKTAIRLDPNDPLPWIYLAQLQNETGQPNAARQSLREAEKRKASRGVYRGDKLLNEDEQTIQSNLAMVYRKLGMSELAWQTLAAGAGDKNAQTLKNQAEILQGQRFAENARRSLALQSLFDDDRSSLPVSLDIYSDGAGQSGSQTPQQGAIEVTGQQASYGDYGALFTSPPALEIGGVVGSNQTWGEQIRASVGGEQFGLSLAQRHYQTNGVAHYDDLDNAIWQATLKWDPQPDMRLFLSYQNFSSDRGSVLFPQDWILLTNAAINEDSWTARLGLRLRLDSGSEIRGYYGHQKTDYSFVYDFGFGPILPATTGDVTADGGEIQYRRHTAESTFSLGLQLYREESEFPSAFVKREAHANQIYASQKLHLNSQWAADWSLGWAWAKGDDKTGGGSNTKLDRARALAGLSYTPDEFTRMRLTVGQGMNLPAVGGATLEPVETAGMIFTRQSDIGRFVRTAELSGERHLAADWLLSGRAVLRNMDDPVFDGIGQVLRHYQQKDGQAALHWMPAQKPLSASLSMGIEKRETPDPTTQLDSISWQRLTDVRLAASWMIDANWSARAEVSRNWVEGEYQQLIPPFLTFKDASTQVNASLRWQQGQGMAELGVRNLLDEHFEYTETDPLAPRFSKGRFVYGSIRWHW